MRHAAAGRRATNGFSPLPATPNEAHFVLLLRPRRRAYHEGAAGFVPGDDDFGLRAAPFRPASGVGRRRQENRPGRRFVRSRSERQGTSGRPGCRGRHPVLRPFVGHVRPGERRQAPRLEASGVGDVSGVHGQRSGARRVVQRGRRFRGRREIFRG